ncbi:hypothetical protein cyc_04705 [Cyclospora cayetanensis]|uniref:Uncharacterized protein n=1 Tax=Cyclospora cayetanensis TaxID=88456 RepID=A0A1D3D2T8_9EIME|nr:hypothetical protein cyc_04705 [Cyclospora cayetanensis]
MSGAGETACICKWEGCPCASLLRVHSPSSSVFVLTDVQGCRLYGHCLRFFELVTLQRSCCSCVPPSAEGVARDWGEGAASTRASGAPAAASEEQQEAVGKADDDAAAKTFPDTTGKAQEGSEIKAAAGCCCCCRKASLVYVERAFCILSAFPFFGAFSEWLWCMYTSYAALSLMYPLRYSQVFVPLLPEPLTHFISMPLPFCVGMQTPQPAQQLLQQWSGAEGNRQQGKTTGSTKKRGAAPRGRAVPPAVYRFTFPDLGVAAAASEAVIGNSGSCSSRCSSCTANCTNTITTNMLHAINLFSQALDTFPVGVYLVDLDECCVSLSHVALAAAIGDPQQCECLKPEAVAATASTAAEAERSRAWGRCKLTTAPGLALVAGAVAAAEATSHRDEAWGRGATISSAPATFVGGSEGQEDGDAALNPVTTDSSSSVLPVWREFSGVSFESSEEGEALTLSGVGQSSQGREDAGKDTAAGRDSRLKANPSGEEEQQAFRSGAFSGVASGGVLSKSKEGPLSASRTGAPKALLEGAPLLQEICSTQAFASFIQLQDEARGDAPTASTPTDSPFEDAQETWPQHPVPYSGALDAQQMKGCFSAYPTPRSVRTSRRVATAAALYCQPFFVCEAQTGASGISSVPSSRDSTPVTSAGPANSDASKQHEAAAFSAASHQSGVHPGQLASRGSCGVKYTVPLRPYTVSYTALNSGSSNSNEDEDLSWGESVAMLLLPRSSRCGVALDSLLVSCLEAAFVATCLE